ncbi:hypothetical protein L3V86_08705 [Thiotrichales bacterium 19S11-10]|nr:hypothetical protein [Thiotrichales bacterium 19S11-10]MCF6807292.1 hypothetical protein [Thiotrichales bacterium 19S9-11]MCF6811261.1 hypothetical protein [Thiotrichales bacterium 19S9-12]
MQFISDVLVTLAKAKGITFTRQGSPIEPEVVFAPNGILPHMSDEANKLCDFIFGWRAQGQEFPDQDGFHGRRLQLNDDLDRLYILCMFLYDQLLSWQDNAPDKVIDLDNF